MLTHITVRPAARGGKYLGEDATNPNAKNPKSALVCIWNKETGGMLQCAFANAPTKASAGPPNLMDPVRRCDPFATAPDTVEVRFQVDISEPTVFTVWVLGPLSHIDQARTVQSDITVLPGVDIGSNPLSTDALAPAKFPEGLVLEIPGLCVSNVSAVLPTDPKKQVSCSAKVTMMCGCPINNIPNWYWPPSDFVVQLVTYLKSGAILKYTLDFNILLDVSSSFYGVWDNQITAGDSVEQAWVLAYQPKLGNQGMCQYPPAPPKLSEEVQRLLAIAGHEV